MPVCLNTSGNSHKTVFLSRKSQSWNIIVEVSCSIVIDRSLLSLKNGSHKDLTSKLITLSIYVVLGHDSSKRMSSNIDFVTRESITLHLVNGTTDVVVDQKRLWGIKDEFWYSNISIVSILSGCVLESLSDALVIIGFSAGSLDPNKTNVLVVWVLLWSEIDI